LKGFIRHRFKCGEVLPVDNLVSSHKKKD